ncbi:MAG: TetR/AcrR family transcriptional regulator [Actinomycetota bacterium]
MVADRKTDAASPRRGRLPAAEREARQRAVLDAALETLIADGVDRMTMLAVAKRAGASKETLYSWFGSREGLLRALIERNADASAERVRAALDPADDDRGWTDPVETLVGYATGLLRLLTSPPSIALNRAAMGDAELAAALLAGGRHRVGPLVERYLTDQAEAGRLDLAIEPAAAFELLYGLVVQDTQIRVLLGEEPPPPGELERRATTAVTRFLRLAADAEPTP